MANNTAQMDRWSSDFGRAYTDRNSCSVAEMDEMYKRNLGLTRSQLNSRFLDNMDRKIRILEVGANVGTQLRGLRAMGFTNLYGIELQRYAIEQAQDDCQGINLVQGNALDIPFKDGYFDLVYTSGVLIHISPNDIARVLSEIHRCSRRFIWGYEYFSETYTEIEYRGHDNLMWKGDFATLYVEQFPDLALVQQEKYAYLDSSNVDAMYLLAKQL